jgi:hypothetical protein
MHMARNARQVHIARTVQKLHIPRNMYPNGQDAMLWRRRRRRRLRRRRVRRQVRRRPGEYVPTSDAILVSSTLEHKAGVKHRAAHYHEQARRP